MNLKRVRTLFCGAIVAIAAGMGSPGAAGAAVPDPEVIYYGGKIVTVNAGFEIVEALAVTDGKIVAVGTSAELRRLAGPSTRLVDLGGKTVLPGFYDNHHHITAGAGDARMQNWEKVNTKEAFLAALAARAAQLPAGQWVIGTLDNENMPQSRVPTAAEMDRVVPNHPVWVRRGHLSVANSMAMRLANVNRNTPQPPGGAIEVDDRGEPIGWFREGAGHRAIQKAIPAPPPLADSIARNTIRGALTEVLRFGITSLGVPGMVPEELRWMQDTYRLWGEQLPRATVQLRIRPGFDDYDDPKEGVAKSLEEIESLRFYTGMGNDRMKLGAIKMSIDGGFSAAAFWTTEPYPNQPDHHGVIRIPAETFYPVAKRAHDLGWQLGVHAIGDGAVEMVVDAYERILRESPRADHRHYLHHFSVKPSAQTMKKVADLDILVASQPNFTYSLGPYNASPALTPARLATNNPQKSLRDLGVRVSFGSDGMPLGPLVGIYAAVTRRGIDGKVYGPQEAISLQDAIRSYTLESAYLSFDEEKKGSLEVGKYADMIVLSEDILTIDPLKIMEIEVEKTIVGGEVLYSSTPM